jgi:hypothetical protein
MKTKLIIPIIIVTLMMVILVSALASQEFVFTPKTYEALAKYKTIKIGSVEKEGIYCYYNQTLNNQVQRKFYGCGNITDAKEIIDLRDVKAVQYLEYQYEDKGKSKAGDIIYGEETEVIPVIK